MYSNLIADLFRTWDIAELTSHYSRLQAKTEKTKFDKVSINCIEVVLNNKS